MKILGTLTTATKTRTLDMETTSSKTQSKDLLNLKAIMVKARVTIIKDHSSTTPTTTDSLVSTSSTNPMDSMEEDRVKEGMDTIASPTKAMGEATTDNTTLKVARRIKEVSSTTTSRLIK